MDAHPSSWIAVAVAALALGDRIAERLYAAFAKRSDQQAAAAKMQFDADQKVKVALLEAKAETLATQVGKCEEGHATTVKALTDCQQQHAATDARLKALEEKAK